MDIYIYGTKGGARPFYQTSQGVAAVFDDCRGFGNGKTLGQTAYSIEYTKNGVAFTKWIIVDDAIRDSIGFIAFAVEIKKETKLKGKEVLDLIDNLLKEYQQNYLVNRYEIGDIKEDWSFVNTLKSNYQGKLTNAEFQDTYEKSDKDAAFIYYSSLEELQNYFDVPYQQDYESYKRVFFVDEKYKGTEENPLKALRHKNDADLTSRKILENLRYRVIIPGAKNGISTKVTKAGITIRNHENIHPLDNISINFSKENHHDSTINGTIKELKEKHGDRVKVDSGNRTLSIALPNHLEPKTKTIRFTVQDWKGVINEHAKIIIIRKGDIEPKLVEKSKATFSGDELSETWEVKIDGKNEITFVPNDSEYSRTITINEEKIVEFKVGVKNHSLSVKGYNRDVQLVGNKIKFTNSAIENDCIVTISADGYEHKIIDFVPKHSNTIDVTLKKKKIEKYFVNAGKGTNKGYEYVDVFKGEHPDYKEIKKQIIPPKGKRFKKPPFIEQGYRTQDKTTRSQGTVIAQYEDIPKFYKNRKFISGVASVLVIGGLFFFALPKMQGSKKSGKISEYEKIENYTKNNDLKLDEIKNHIQKVRSMSSKKADNKKRWWERKRSKNQKNENQKLNWSELTQRLEKLKSIREAINNGEIDTLQKVSKQFDYSPEQQAFKVSVSQIDSIYSQKISMAMKGPEDEVSILKIDQIAAFLNDYQYTLKIEEDIKTSKDIEYLEAIKTKIDSISKLSIFNLLPTAKKEVNRILELVEVKLEKAGINEKGGKENGEAKTGNTSNTTHAQSSSSASSPDKNDDKFKEKFWKLVADGNKNYDTYKQLFNSNTSHLSGDFSSFYQTYVSKESSFASFGNIPEGDLKNSKSLSSLIELIKKEQKK